MTDDALDERPGCRAPVGFLFLAFEVLLWFATLAGISSDTFIAPVALVFLLLDHSEFVAVVVVLICIIDWFVTPTKPRAVTIAAALGVGMFLIFGSARL